MASGSASQIKDRGIVWNSSCFFNEIKSKCTWEFVKSLAMMLVFITELEAPPYRSDAQSPATDDDNGINCTQY